MCSSQSLRFQTSDFGVSRGTVAPGTKMSETTKMPTTGTPALRTTRSQEGQASDSVNGKLEASACQYSYRNVSEQLDSRDIGVSQREGSLVGLNIAETQCNEAAGNKQDPVKSVREKEADGEAVANRR